MSYGRDTARGIGGTVSGAMVVGDLGIAAKEAGIAPELANIIVSAADSIPGILTAASDIQIRGAEYWLQQNTGVDLGSNFETLANLNSNLAIFGVIYIIARLVGGKEGRLSALGGSLLWTSIAAMAFNEFHGMINGVGPEFLETTYDTVYNSIGDKAGEIVDEGGIGNTLYAGISAIVGLVSSGKAIKGIRRVFFKEEPAQTEVPTSAA